MTPIIRRRAWKPAVLALLAPLLLLAGGGQAGAPVYAAPQSGAAEGTGSDPSGESSSPETVGEGMLCVAENGGRKLWIDLATTNIQIENADGSVFSAFPAGSEEDEVATGSVRNNMKSLLLVTYIDEQNASFSVGSQVGSVRQSSYTIRKITDGVRIDFHFSREKEQFTIPLRLTLVEGVLRAEVVFQEIEEAGTARITEVQLLPYFLSGRKGEEGYVLVPDGSGMAIAFDEPTPGSFSQPVYGTDPALTKRTQTGVQQTVQLPVIGMEKGGRAAVGILEQGDAIASIEAQSPGVDSSYASVSPSFTYRQMDISVLADSAWNEREVTVVSDRTAEVNPVVTYHFLEGDQAQPAGMAAVYRDYLLAQGVTARIPEGPLPCSFEVFGAVGKSESFLGFPVTRTVSATTAADLEEMVAAFREAGIPSSWWTLYGFTRGGMYGGKIGDASIDGAVDGKGAYRSLLEAAGEQGAQIYLGADLQNVYRQSFGYSFLNAPVKQLSGDNAYQYRFKRNLPSRDKSFQWLLLKPGRLAEAAEDFLDGYRSVAGAGIALLSAGDSLYADYNRSGYVSRTDALAAMVGMGQALREGAGKVLTAGGNAYALRYADGVLNIPASSSGYAYASWDIPFYQLVLHGLLPMTAAPTNARDGDSWQHALQNLETGMLPSYRLTGSSPEVYRDTQLNFLFHTDYRDWVEECAAEYETFAQVHQPLAGQTITAYARIGEARRVVYADGTVIYVNYADQEAAVDGHTVPARGHLVVAPQP